MFSQELAFYNKFNCIGTNVCDKSFVNELQYFNKVGLLYMYLCIGERKKYFLLFNDIFEFLSSKSTNTSIVQRSIYLTVNSMLVSYINMHTLLSKDHFHTEINLFTQMDIFKSWDEAVQYLKAISKKIFDMSEKNENKTTDTVDKVKNIICNHLHDDLSLKKLAGMVYLNPSYLSRSFKHAAGLNVSDYIKKMRVKKAKKYLLQSQKKIQDISSLVGFSSPSYFIRFFKQSVGLTPSQYRTTYASYVTE